MALLGNLKGAAGGTGAPGAAGAAGTQWHFYTRDPTAADAAIGNDNDVWLNNVSGDLFKKSAGTWL